MACPKLHYIYHRPNFSEFVITTTRQKINKFTMFLVIFNIMEAKPKSTNCLVVNVNSEVKANIAMQVSIPASACFFVEHDFFAA